jgi:uncharacterized Zn finger protein (UPF0148 family)
MERTGEKCPECGEPLFTYAEDTMIKELICLGCGYSRYVEFCSYLKTTINKPDECRRSKCRYFWEKMDEHEWGCSFHSKGG